MNSKLTLKEKQFLRELLCVSFLLQAVDYDYNQLVCNEERINYDKKKLAELEKSFKERWGITSTQAEKTQARIYGKICNQINAEAARLILKGEL